MKSRTWCAVAQAALILALAGCGGGGNESGSPDAIIVSPSEVTVSGPAGACAVGPGPTVHLYGGRPPYKLSNSVPYGLALDRTHVQDSGEGFTIEFTNGVCMDGMPVTIEDSMGEIATLTVTNGEGGD